MLVLNNTPFVHARGYLEYLNSALPRMTNLLYQDKCLSISKLGRVTEMFHMSIISFMIFAHIQE